MAAVAVEDEVPGDGGGGDRLIPALPDDVSIRCIAVLPFSCHPTLAAVSRSWRRLLLLSPPHILLAARRHYLAAGDHLLCLSLRSPSHPYLHFFLLHRQLGPTPLPAPPLRVSSSAAAVAAGHLLFLLGGAAADIPTAAVQVLDSRSFAWSRGPRMSSPREFAAAAFLSGHILAVGGCPPFSDSWAESLPLADAAGRWVTVPSPVALRDKWMHGCAVLRGRLLAVADRRGVAYDPTCAKPGASWATVPAALDMGWKGRAAVVGGILYSYDFLGKIKGYDPDADEWRMVEGLEKDLPKFLCGATLANLGGTLCVVWEGKDGKNGKGRKNGVAIDWAGIEVLRSGNGRLQGRILWMESVILDAPKGSSIAHCVALEL